MKSGKVRGEIEKKWMNKVEIVGANFGYGLADWKKIWNFIGRQEKDDDDVERGQEKETAVGWALQLNDPSCSYLVTSSVKAIAGQ